MEKNKKENSAAEQVKNAKGFRVAVSILAALVIWLSVGDVNSVSVKTTVRDIPVEFTSEDTTLADNGLMLLSGYDTTIDLTIRGPRKVLWQLDKDEIRIVADTSGIVDTGIQSLTYEVVYPDNVPSSQLQLQSASAYSVTVTVGELYTKEVPVYCDVIGQVADGYVAQDLVLDPLMLVLRAQRNELLNVNYAKVTLDISNAEETVIENLEYTLYDFNDIAIENPNVRATTKRVQATLPIKAVKDVGLTVNFVEEVGSSKDQMTYSIDPSTVRLMGDKDVLTALDTIVLDTVYLQDLDAYQTLTYTIPLPEGTEIVGEDTTATVTIVVNNVSERRVAVNSVICENIPEGYEAVPATEKLDILLRGLTDELDALTAENLTVVADLKNVKEAGSYTVPVTVRVTGYENVGVKGSYQVVVNVAKTPEKDPEDQTNTPGTDTPADNGVATAALTPTDSGDEPGVIPAADSGDAAAAAQTADGGEAAIAQTSLADGETKNTP